MTCFYCRGYTVIHASHFWGPYVTGGDPCPVCKATGRVPGKAAALYVERCPHSKLPGVEGPIWDPRAFGEGVLRCCLEDKHEGLCDFKPWQEVEKLDFDIVNKAMEADHAAPDRA